MDHVAASAPPSSTTTSAAAAAAALETSIFAESALIDRETGRIYWEGGSSSTLAGSVESRLQKLGLLHARATFVSILLWVIIYGWISSWLRTQVQSSQLIQNLQSNIMTAIPVVLCKWTILAVPRVPVWVLVTVVIIYFVEAYLCDEHQFLAHRSDSHDVETYIEQLRERVPQIVWKVRAYHYEPWPPQLMALCKWWTRSGWWQQQKQKQTTKQINDTDKNKSMADIYDENDLDTTDVSWWNPLFRRKCVTHQATSSFACPQGGWHDQTTAGVWTRATGETRRRGPAPLAKIHLTKVLVLGSAEARQEYFEQQARFVADHGKGDTLAEFATSIEVPGYKPRVLVTRDPQASLLFSRRVFWVCTVLGFSVFYRVWMARHCDVIRVSLVKETMVRTQPEKKKVSWWSSQKSTRVTKQETHAVATTKFRTLMTQLELYRPKNVTAVDVEQNETTTLVHPLQNTTNLTNEKRLISLQENTTNIEESTTTPENINALAEVRAFASDGKTTDLLISSATNDTTVLDESTVLLSDNTTLVGNATLTSDDPLVANNFTAVNLRNIIPETNSSEIGELGNLTVLNETDISEKERHNEDKSEDEDAT